MQKTTLFLFLVLFTFSPLWSQNTSSSDKLRKRNAAQLMRFDNQNHRQANFTSQIYSQLGLDSAEDLQMKQKIEGQNGWVRYRMKQQYKDLRVVGASYTLHEQHGQIKKSSGDLLPFIDIDIKPNINKTEAINAARNYTNSKLLSKTEGAAVVLPDWDIEQADLVVMDYAYPKFSGNYTLAYHVIISNLEGKNQYRESVYVDAKDGSVLESISEIAHTSVEGIAITNYYGEQRIITDSIAPDLYYLRDSTRGGGIITHNGSLDNFEDEDNFWNNFGAKEEVGTDAHYCASAYYDYMLDNFAWDGLDGEGFELRSRVYGDERNTVNATWNGSYSTFFSGDCDEFGPLTTLDVVGHEFAHGFTDFTSDLIYRNESGALNESISDILGKALEFTYDPENANWFIGAKFVLTDENDHFRDMSDPNKKNHPKLYAGEYWEFGSRDNGGVHINSGVLNFWYFLLTEGLADVNELGVAYDVSPIGMEKATAIVFTMNTAYLTESSSYTKAVVASIESVKDLFGENSQEMASVLEAWKAVGLSPESGEYDVTIEMLNDRPFVCADDIDNFPVEVIVLNNGQNPYLVGDVMYFSYSVEEEDTTAVEEFTLIEDLFPGDTLFYTYSQVPTGLETGSNFDIEVFLEATAMSDPNAANGELITTNNKDEARITTTDMVGLDIRVFSLTLTSRSTCEFNQESQLRLSIQNTGCEEIPEGDYTFTLVTPGAEYNYDVRLPFDLRAGSFATIFDFIVLPEEITNGMEVTAVLKITNDVNADNDSIEGQYLFLETVNEGYIEPFDNFDILTSTEIFIDPDFRSDAQIGEVNGNQMLIISGTNSEPFALEDCGEQDVFFRENFQKTDIEMCINTVGIIDPTLSFDMIQYRADEAIENIDPSFSVMALVTIDDNEVEYPLIAGQEEGEMVRHDFPLPQDFSGEVLIEVMTLRGNGAIVSNGNFADGDFALIDNIQITSGTVSSQSVLESKEVLVFPNPSSQSFNFTHDVEGEYDLMIYDGLGRVIYQERNDNVNSVWDASQAEGGIYFYEVRYEKGGELQGKLVLSK